MTKRERIEELVLGTISRLETGDENTKRYKSFFKSMNDEEFAEWASKFESDSFTHCIQVFTEPFKEPRMGNIEAAAEYLGVPLTQYIYFRDHGERPVRSRMKVPVGYVHIKRMQQLLSKKNHYAFDAEERSLKTDQVSGNSKVASMSDVEASALAVINAEEALREFFGFRSDDAFGKMQAYKQISDQGFIMMSDLDRSQSSAGQALETVNTYLLCSGIKTDLVNTSLKTRYTIDQELKNK